MIRIAAIALILISAGVMPVFASDGNPEGTGCSDLIPPVTIKNLRPEHPPVSPAIHPPVMLLDKESESVIDTGAPVSFMETCGGCHDSSYIDSHQYHSRAGMDEMDVYASDGPGRPWDVSPGLFGKWDPLTYRVLSREGADLLDMGTADWIRFMAPRHPGGGPAEISRFADEALDKVVGDGTVHPDTHVMDPQTGESVPWDWEASGTVELNCLLCHIPAPNNAARIREIQAGRFKWASTATLEGTGIVTRLGDTFQYNPEAFDEDGNVNVESFRVGDPDSGNCRLCHGRACRCADPVIFENSLDNWSTETTGEVFSPELLSRSGMNLQGKTQLFLPWDLHAQRLLKCTNCHFSPNNPAYNRKETQAADTGHLQFDARKNALGDYLDQPDHDLAKGFSSQSTVSRHRNGTMRECRDCHRAEVTHIFLPYKSLHYEKLSCQACHIPRVNAPVRQMTDWTVLASPGVPVTTYRGLDGPINDPSVLITGYEPILLQQEAGETLRLKPHNLITSYFWVAGTPPAPVRLFELEKLYFQADGTIRPEIVDILDSDGDGNLSSLELRLDTPEKADAIREKLVAMGLKNPEIQGEIQPYSLSHGVMTGDYAMRDCKDCHSYSSRISAGMILADYAPGGVLPQPVKDTRAVLEGEITVEADGSVLFKSGLDPGELYIHGSDRLKWMDFLGLLVVGAVIGGSAVHGGLRFFMTVWKRSRK